jgi:hypothetical protein
LLRASTDESVAPVNINARTTRSVAVIKRARFRTAASATVEKSADETSHAAGGTGARPQTMPAAKAAASSASGQSSSVRRSRAARIF